MKIAVHDSLRSRRPRASESAILFTVSRQLFAIAADAVQEIRSTDSIAGAASELESSALPKVRHTLQRGPRQYYVVNACVHFGLPIARPTLVLILRELRVAVLIDRIDRMIDLPAVYDLPRAFSGDERRWYRGLAYLDDHAVPVIAPRGFFTPDEFQLLDKVAHLAEPQLEPQGTALK